MHPRRALLPLLLVNLACKEEAPKTSPKEAQLALVDFDDPATCQPCHEAVYREWTTSMHAHAHEDPIFVGVRKLRSTKEQGLEEKCGVCHEPRRAQTGVTCAACHAAESVEIKHGRGKKALTWSKDTLYGPHDLAPGLTPAHQTGPSKPHMKDGTNLCFACHADLSNEKGVPLCQTATEWNQAETTKACAECHMPESEGPSGMVSNRKKHRSHRFTGPRQLWTETATAVRALEMVGISGELSKGKLTIALENRTGHAFPSGFPGRMAKVVLTGRDAKGREVWKEEVPLRKVYVDEAGKPVIAAWAVKIAEDTRLKPTETRKLEKQVPKKVRSVDVEVLHWLLPPPLAEKIGLKGADVAEMRVVAEGSVP